MDAACTASPTHAHCWERDDHASPTACVWCGVALYKAQEAQDGEIDWVNAQAEQAAFNDRYDAA